jgi:hypothetical protein
MFCDMRVRLRWNVDGALLWGYFFTDPERRKLTPVADYLTRNGYREASIGRSADEHGRTYSLRVERIEHHTPETLHERNQELADLAETFNLESYGGMDVGPVRH